MKKKDEIVENHYRTVSIVGLVLSISSWVFWPIVTITLGIVFGAVVQRSNNGRTRLLGSIAIVNGMISAVFFFCRPYIIS